MVGLSTRVRGRSLTTGHGEADKQGRWWGLAMPVPQGCGKPRKTCIRRQVSLDLHYD